MNNNYLNVDMQEKNILSDEQKKPARYNRFWHAFIVFTFCALIFTVLILRVVLPTPTVSMAENRELKKMPSTEAGNIFFGKFTTDFEDFFSDTFPLRDTLLGADDYVSWLNKIPVEGVDSVVVMNENMMQDAGGDDEDTGGSADAADNSSADAADNGAASGTQSPQASESAVSADNPVSAEGDDNAEAAGDTQQKGIYLITDTAIFQEVVLDSEETESFANGVNKFAGALPGKRVIVMSPPNSFAFYADPKYITPQTDQKAGIEDMYGMIDSAVYKVDTYFYLDAHKNEYIYFRTDHHWTDLGAYYGYEAFCDALGISPVSIDTMQKTTFRTDFLGALYKETKTQAKTKLLRNNPDYIDYYVPQTICSETIYNKTPLKDGESGNLFDLDLAKGDTNFYHIFLGGDFAGVKITTDTQNGKSIVILKDSFANSFTPYLTAHYQNIYLVDFRDFNTKGYPKFSLEQFVNDNNIDDVLLEMNFRYTSIPGDVDWYLKALS